MSPRAERLFEDANDLYAEQDKIGAVNTAELERRYQFAADADSSFAEPLYNLGLLYQRDGKYDLAAQAYAEALRRKPSLARACENLALVRESQGQDAQAAMLLEAAAKTYPRDAGVRARLAELYLREADSEHAREWARSALMRDSKNLVAYRVLLEISLRQGEDDMVRLLALKSQKAEPQDPLPAYYLGKLAAHHNEKQKAMAEYKASLSLKPDFEPALVEVAALSLASQDYVTAEAALRKVLQLDPHACGAHLNLGVCERGLAKPDVAASEYQEALRCDPKLIAAYYDLGILDHHVRNDCTGAIDNYRKFISGNVTPLPGDHPVFAALQECQERKASDDQKKPELAPPGKPAATAVAPSLVPTAAPALTPAPSASLPAPDLATPAPPADPNEPQN